MCGFLSQYWPPDNAAQLYIVYLVSKPNIAGRPIRKSSKARYIQRSKVGEPL